MYGWLGYVVANPYFLTRSRSDPPQPTPPLPKYSGAAAADFENNLDFGDFTQPSSDCPTSESPPSLPLPLWTGAVAFLAAQCLILAAFLWLCHHRTRRRREEREGDTRESSLRDYDPYFGHFAFGGRAKKEEEVLEDTSLDSYEPGRSM